MPYPPISGAARGANEVKLLDSLERWLDSKWVDFLGLEPHLRRRRLFTSLAINLVTGVTLAGVGYALRLTLGPTGVAVAALVGFAVVYGAVAYLVYRYINRRRADSLAPQPPAPPLPP